MSLDRDEHAEVCRVMAETLAGSTRHTFMGTGDELIDALEEEGWAIVPVERLAKYDRAIATGKELAHQVADLIVGLEAVAG